MAKRQMPTKGFYVWDHHKHPMQDCDGWTHRGVIYTSGVRGGGQHKYWRSDHSDNVNPPPDQTQWTTLLWSCVPGQLELNEYYCYFKDIHAAITFYKS